jgi:hypothetical protein
MTEGKRNHPSGFLSEMAFGFHRAGKACGVLESAATSGIGAHLHSPHNAGSLPEAQFFNTLFKLSAPSCRES